MHYLKTDKDLQKVTETEQDQIWDISKNRSYNITFFIFLSTSSHATLGFFKQFVYNFKFLFFMLTFLQQKYYTFILNQTFPS